MKKDKHLKPSPERPSSSHRLCRDHLESILASVADALVVTDRNDRIILGNKAAEDLFATDSRDMISMSLQELLAKHALSIIDLDKMKHSGRTQRFDMELPTEDQRGIRMLQGISSPVCSPAGDSLGCTVLLFHDITYERELDRLKTEFVSMAAHELRTPLTTIRGFSELLLERSFSRAEQKKFLFYINQQAEHLTQIINDLLDISRIESGQGFVLSRSETAISLLVQEVITVFQEQESGHSYALQLQDTATTLDIDKDKIRQVLENILSNAVKYSPDGGRILVEGNAAEHSYVLAISDKGIGMTPDQMAHIYDKFYRADNSDTAIGGTGLGMGIARYIIEAHDGAIDVQSQYGVGTTVSITLPTGKKE